MKLRKETIIYENEYGPITGKLKVAEKEVYEIVMSCGGGFGGSSWKEYSVDKPHPIDGLQELRMEDGSLKMINSRYIVSVRERKAVTITEDITNWYNYDNGSNHSYADRNVHMLDGPKGHKFVVRTYHIAPDDKYVVREKN